MYLWEKGGVAWERVKLVKCASVTANAWESEVLVPFVTSLWNDEAVEKDSYGVDWNRDWDTREPTWCAITLFTRNLPLISNSRKKVHGEWKSINGREKNVTKYDIYNAESVQKML